uniref:DNA pilot protein n=1 Tax=Dulem virus 200 TaxID=3145677 RepID=A0AAU8B5F4_9VIRU
MAAPLIAAAGISALASGVTAAINNSAANSAASKQYQRQLEFWKLQNEYNSPVEQRKRLEAAGLNPALMYSGGNFTNDAGSLSDAPGNEYAKSGVLPDSLPTGIIDAAVKAATIKQIEAQTRKTDAETDNIEQDTEMFPYRVELMKEQTNLFQAEAISERYKQTSMNISNKLQRLEYEFQSDTFEDRKKIVRADFEKLRNEIALQFQEMVVNARYIKEKFPLEVQTMKNTLLLQMKEHALMQSQIELNTSIRKLNEGQLEQIKQLLQPTLDKFQAEIDQLTEETGWIKWERSVEIVTSVLSTIADVIAKAHSFGSSSAPYKPTIYGAPNSSDGIPTYRW